MFEKDRLNLLTLLDTIVKIAKYSSGYKNSDDFYENQRDFDASMMNFIIIGEMVSRLSDKFIEENNQIDWFKIRGLRNIVAHDYFGIDAEADIPIPDYYQGQPFLGTQKAEPRTYVFGARDRMDLEYDMVRAVRDKRYKYFRNYQPELPYYQNIIYRLQMDMMNEMLQMHADGKLNAVQELWFRQLKPEEELYDTWEDPHELNNLAADPAYAEKLAELRAAHLDWQEKHGDLGFIDEKELRAQFWPEDSQPKTAEPVVTYDGEYVSITCETPGSHIVYKHLSTGAKRQRPYPIYVEPVPIHSDGTFHCRSERYGYLPSQWITTEITTSVQTKSVSDYQLAISNYPNPFNPQTTFTFTLPQSGQINLSIFNALGKKVKTLIDANYNRGKHQKKWDGTDDVGKLVSSGVYYYRLQTPRQVLTGKTILGK